MEERDKDSLQQRLQGSAPALSVAPEIAEENIHYESDVLLEDPVFYILADGKKAIRRRRFRNILFVIGNGLLAAFLTLAREGLQTPFKYLISCVSLPMEIINLVAQVKNAIEKDKPLQIFLFIIFGSLLSIGLLIITDIVKWMGWTTGVLATMASAGPFLFAGFMTIYGILNVIGLIKSGRELYQKAYYRTSLKTLALINKALRGSGCFLLAGLMIPFVFMLMANPVGATALLVTIVTITAGLIAWKIAKTIIENRTWKKTSQTLQGQDPYILLNVDRNLLEAKLNLEGNTTKNFLVKTKAFFQKKWYQLFGTAQQKKMMRFSEKSSAASYIKQCYKYTLMPAKITVDRLKEQLYEMRQKDASPLDIQRLEAELTAAQAQYQHQKAHLFTRPEFETSKNAYDLIRKPKGRVMYQQNTITEAEVKAALAPERYIPVYCDELGFSLPHSKTPEPAFAENENQNVFDMH